MNYSNKQISDFLKQLVNIPSVNPSYAPKNANYVNEKQLAHFLKAWFEAKQLKPTLQKVSRNRPNIEVKIGKGHPHLMLCTHLDTVGIETMTISPFKATVKKGNLYGRGALDAKGMIAFMTFAFLNVIKFLPPNSGTLSIVFVADEEDEQTGVRTYLEKNKLPDAAIIGESTDLQVGLTQCGGMKFKLSFHGKSSHACKPGAGADANLAMAIVRCNLDKFIRSKRHPKIGYRTMNFGVIQGGKHASVISDYCEVDIDYRLLPGEQGKNVLREFDQYLKGQKLPDGVSYQRHPPYLGPLIGFETPAKETIVRAFKHEGFKGGNVGLPFGSDANYFHLAGVPTVIFGPGDMIAAHTQDEHLSLKSLFEGVAILGQTIENYFTLMQRVK